MRAFVYCLANQVYSTRALSLRVSQTKKDRFYLAARGHEAKENNG